MGHTTARRRSSISSAPTWTRANGRPSLDGTPARLVFVNTTSSSFEFVQALSGKNRIVIAATDSAAQKYATVFPQYFIEALDQGAKADNDKNGRLSVWEAFTYASQAVKQAFEQKGTLVTERSIIDDNGDGVGKEAAAAAGDGVLARTTFLDPPPASSSANAAVAALDKRRIAIEVEIEQLKAQKGEMPAGQYEEEFERLAIELAKISAQIRSTSNFPSQRTQDAKIFFNRVCARLGKLTPSGCATVSQHQYPRHPGQKSRDVRPEGDAAGFRARSRRAIRRR